MQIVCHLEQLLIYLQNLNKILDNTTNIIFVTEIRIFQLETRIRLQQLLISTSVPTGIYGVQHSHYLEIETSLQMYLGW